MAGRPPHGHQDRSFDRELAECERAPGLGQQLGKVADQRQVAVGQVVEGLRHRRARAHRAHRGVRVQPGRHPALVRGRPRHHLGDRRDDHRVAEVDHPARVDSGGVRPDHVDMVVVGPGPVGQLPDVGRTQQRRRPADHLGAGQRGEPSEAR